MSAIGSFLVSRVLRVFVGCLRKAAAMAIYRDIEEAWEREQEEKESTKRIETAKRRVELEVLVRREQSGAALDAPQSVGMPPHEIPSTKHRWRSIGRLVDGSVVDVLPAMMVVKCWSFSLPHLSSQRTHHCRLTHSVTRVQGD